MELHRKASFDSQEYAVAGRLPCPIPLLQGRKREADDRAIKLLLVEHDSNYAAQVKRFIGEQGNPVLQLEWTKWLDVASHRIQKGQVDAVLLDISLPDISGIEIFRSIHHAAPQVPILVLADLDDETVACQLLREGAQDYLPKHALYTQQISRSVRFAVERAKARKRPVQRKGAVDLPQPFHDLLTSFPRSDQAIRILMVENSDEDYRKLRACLEGQQEIRLTRTRTIRGALRVLARRAFDLVCLDYLLPDGTGHDFLTKMKESGPDIPTVVITAHSDPMAAAQIIQAGAYDYLPKKNLSRGPLFRIIVNAMEKARLRKQVQEAQKKIVEMSIMDDLTRLHNRRYFTEALEKETGRARRYGSPLVLCMMDVDEFKKVNDTFGHRAGDMVLRELGDLLRKSVRLSDTACRYGGEEFALLLPNTDPGEAKILGERLRHKVENRRFSWNDSDFRVTLSFGLAALGSGDDPSSARLVELADRALYTAKRKGKNRVVTWEEECHERG